MIRRELVKVIKNLIFEHLGYKRKKRDRKIVRKKGKFTFGN